MAEKKDEGKESSRSSDASSKPEPQTGDPGRTPGTAEGDRKTVEEDLEEQG